MVEEFLQYIASERRYSPRTCAIYREALECFYEFAYPHQADEENGPKVSLSGQQELEALTFNMIRGYVASSMEAGLSPRTVNLHLSAMSSFCTWLVRHAFLKSNPVRRISRPKESRRLPEFYTEPSLEHFFDDRGLDGTGTASGQMDFHRYRNSVMLLVLYATGMRRSEIVSLKQSDYDPYRRVFTVLGKGDKMREIPAVPSLLKEISLYLRSVELMVSGDRTPDSPLFVTFSGKALYPGYVDRAIKSELGEIGSITGRKSPHVLRHTLATELLDEGTGLNAIKELLGHSSLAATQVYTHNTIGRLKKVYESAHPRARKNGGKNGD